jgi:hypothetical protein
MQLIYKGENAISSLYSLGKEVEVRHSVTCLKFQLLLRQRIGGSWSKAGPRQNRNPIGKKKL